MNTLLGVVGTDKSYRIGDFEKSQVVFKVSLDSNKLRVKKAVSALFGVDVLSVNIINCKGKSRRFGRSIGKTKAFKKAIVILKEGEDIDFGSKSMMSSKKEKDKKDKKDKKASISKSGDAKSAAKSDVAAKVESKAKADSADKKDSKNISKD